MYNPTHFTETRLDALAELVRAHPLGALVTQGPQGLDANHLPFELDLNGGGLGVLRAHVARANPLWQEHPSGSTVMVIFRGAEAYVSPNWYPGKHETHRYVPTWNYEVVHAHGVLTIHDDERFVRGLVARLTRQHEASERKPWKMGDSPAEYIHDMLGKIVGVEVRITRLEGKSKLSQNRETRDRLGAAQTLLERGQTELARKMSG